ncbi:hypothetical protein BGZ63DRAFT_368255 [Mariannaea sp. PMI_226]|nr:hypothetical protein BGZ63DRAFT_368255 [Mariannaea sp. PMI_226]
MSSHLEWTCDPCLSCGRQTEGAPYCSYSCRLLDYEKAPTSVPRPSWHPLQIAPSSSKLSDNEVTSSTKTEKELRAYNMSLDRSMIQRRVPQ